MSQYRVTFHGEVIESQDSGKSFKHTIYGHGVPAQVVVSAAASDSNTISAVLTSNNLVAGGTLIIDQISNHDLGIRGGGTVYS